MTTLENTMDAEVLELSNAPALTDIAERINVEHGACRAAMQRGMEHAFKAGQLLMEAKSGLAHGEWLAWLKENCPDISERTAQRYMRLAENRDELEAKPATVADLTMRAAEEALTTPRGIEGNSPYEAPRLSWSERKADGALTPAHQAFLERCLGSMARCNYVIVREAGTALKETRDQELYKPRRNRSGLNKSNYVFLKGRPAYDTFEEYLSEEIGMTIEVAEKLINAATMLNNPRAATQAELLTKIEQIAPGSVTPVGLELPDDLSNAQWIDAGELLSAMLGQNLSDLGDSAIWKEDG